MAVDVILLTADAEGAGGDLVTASISPTGPVLMAAFITQGSIATSPPISGCGLSWTLCARIADASNFRALFLWLGTGTPTEGAITVSEDGNAWDSKSWLVAQVDGASESVIVAENLIADLSTDLEFPQAIAAGNGAFAAFSTSNLYALTPREGWANLLSEAVGVQGAASIAGAWRADGDTHAGGSFPGGSTLYGIAVELEAAGGGDPDTTAPTLSGATATATGATTAEGSVDVDEAATVDAVLTTSATAPTADQIQAGTDHADAVAAATDLGNLASEPGTVNFSYSDLTPATEYWQHVVAEDADGNVSEVATVGPFTTDALGPTPMAQYVHRVAQGAPAPFDHITRLSAALPTTDVEFFDTLVSRGSSYDYYIETVYGSGGSSFSGVAATVTVPITTPEIEIVEGDAAELAADSTLQLTVVATDEEDGDLSESVEWSSSETGVATVSSEGLVTWVGPGEAVITASVTNSQEQTSADTILITALASADSAPTELSASWVEGETPHVLLSWSYPGE